MNDSITQEEHSILGLKWEDGLPFGLFLNLRNNYYEKVNISGNTVTNDSVIRSQLLVDEGDPYSVLLLNKKQQ